MDKITQQNASSSEESASAAEELNSQAEELERMVATFKLSNTMSQPQSRNRITERRGRNRISNSSESTLLDSDIECFRSIKVSEIN